MNMAERKPLSKKLRFEVFKRDKFTCQYCGAQAPDVTLEVDHIEPVAEGGTNDITNLVTACVSCNRGKGAVRLDDDTAVMKQKKQLDMLQERREQLEMLHEWQLSLIDESDAQIRSIEEIIERVTSEEFQFSDFGANEMQRLIRRFGYDTVASATRKSFTYYRHGTDSEWEYALDKIAGICFYMKNKRCSQCKHHEDYDKSDQTATCKMFGFMCSNDAAENCNAFESMFSGGADD